MKTVRAAYLIAVIALMPCALEASPARIYSDVWEHPETGDLLGTELRLIDKGQPTIDFVQCEGWCNYISHIAIVRVRGGFDFAFRDKSCTADGRIADTTITYFRARFWKGNLVLRQPESKEVEVLKLQPSPFGLSIAKQNELKARKNKHIVWC